MNVAYRNPRLWAVLLAFAWGFAEATLFFVVADVVLSWIALRRGLRTAAAAAMAAALGAMIGGQVLYAWSVRAPAQATQAVEAVPAVHAGAVARAETAMREGTWWAVALKASFSGGDPYKVYAAAAPRIGVSAAALAVVTPLIRLPRFLLIGLIFALLAPLIRRRLPERLILPVFVGGWSLFYLAFWTIKGW
jgi:hypothetical protein